MKRIKHTLMHKNVPVLDINIIENSGIIENILTIHNIERLPIGISKEKDFMLEDLNEWWRGRSIPASRDNIRDVLYALEISRTSQLLEKCLGLSLSDQYWICPVGSGLNWKDVNFFENEFSKDMGELLFSWDPQPGQNINLFSPDNTSDGVLRKKWIIVDETRVLVKGGSNLLQQEPFNEKIASMIMNKLNINHVPYDVIYENDNYYSLCDNFVTTDTELVPAARVIQYLRKPVEESTYAHLLRCCDELEIPGVKEAIDKMLTVDYIIVNSDRHFNNFGFIRNVNSLEWEGFAPIFDSGNSLWHNTLNVGQERTSKPFIRNHNSQIMLVDDFSWFEPGKLHMFNGELLNIFATSEIDNARAEKIATAVQNNIEKLKGIAKVKSNVHIVNATPQYNLSAQIVGGSYYAPEIKAMANINIGNSLHLSKVAVKESDDGLHVHYPEVKRSDNVLVPIIEFVKDTKGNLTPEAESLKKAIEGILLNATRNIKDSDEQVPLVEVNNYSEAHNFDVKVKVDRVRDTNNPIKAVVNVVLDNVLQINDAKVVQHVEKHKPHVQMPKKVEVDGSGVNVIAFSEPLCNNISEAILSEYSKQIKFLDIIKKPTQLEKKKTLQRSDNEIK